MSQMKEVIKFTQPWIDKAMDAPTLPLMLDEHGKVVSPFPLSSGGKKILLELIYNRETGIITRQELMDVLFNEEGNKKGIIIETTM